MTLKLTLSQGQLFGVEVTFVFSPRSCSPTLNFLRGGIPQDQDLSAMEFSHPKFSSGWDLGLFDQISLRGGILGSLTRFLFGVGSGAL